MSEDRFIDINACHAFLNALTSGYRGKLAMLRTLDELEPGANVNKEIEETKEILSDLQRWSSKMWEGTPLRLHDLQGHYSEDVQNIIWLANELKLETFERSERLDAIHDFETLENNPSAVHELVSVLAYQATARESYVQGLVKYGEVFDNDFLEHKWERELASCHAQTERAETYFKRCQQNGENDAALIHDLREATLLLPAIFRCQVHDLNQILSMPKGEEFSYGDAEFTPGEAEYWSEFGFDARSAGYWRAHDIPPDEALYWMESGFASPTSAGSWRYRGFSADDAERWAVQGFNAIQAQFFASSGCDSPERAAMFDEWSH